MKKRQVYPVISSLSFLHSLEHPKRLTELSTEVKWEAGDIGDLGGGRKGKSKGEVKRIETNLASDQFPKCSPQPGIPRDSRG